MAEHLNINFWKTWLEDRGFYPNDQKSAKPGCEWVRGCTHLRLNGTKKRPWDCWISSPEGKLGKTRGDTPESAMDMLKMLCKMADRDLSTSLF